MFLKAIELENFKSFGRHLRLPLLPGYTAITGPNGSGKSNLSDAVLFVLGPKSGKVIRAGRLTDLVYNGGKDGKPADHCRVSLVFDNGDRLIPVDSDEVKLTRYVGVSPTVEDGVNSYFYVNNRKATLGDFDALLAHAKISAEGYNIVQQGDVARIVEMSPVDRRRVLEDMAGIRRFDEDIGKAEEKRRGVEEDLARIEIILDEIRRQLRRLEKDREDALRYRQIQESLERARAQEAHKEVALLQHQMANLRDQQGRYGTDRDRLREERARLQEALVEAEERLQALEDEVARQGGSEFQEVKERLDALRVERARAQDTRERSREELRRLRAEATRTGKELEKVAKEIAERTAQQGASQEEVAVLEGEVEARTREIQELEEEASHSDRRVVDLQKALVALEREVDGADGRRRELALEREKGSQTLTLLEEQIAQLEEEEKAARFEIEDTAWQAKESASAFRGVSKKLAWLREEYGAREAERKELTQQAAELGSAVKALSREYSQLKAEAEAVENVQRGYHRAVQAILEARDTGALRGVHGTIAELAEVRPEHEVALNTAAGSRMQAIVVDDDSVAAEAIDLLKSQKLGRAIFLPLNKMLPGRPRGKALLAVREAVGFALDLVAFDEGYRNVFWYVFGDTVVVEDLTQARQLMGGVRLVTLDGQLVEASGAIIGGQARAVVLKFGQAARGQLAEVGEKLRRASEPLQKAEARLRELETELGDLQGRVREFQGEEDRQQAQAADHERRRAELGGRAEALSAALEEKVQRREEARQALVALEAQLAEATAEAEALRTRREAQRQELADATPQRIARRLRQLQAEKLERLERRNGLQSRAETLANQVALLEDRRAELEGRSRELEEGASHQEAEATGAQERLEEADEEIRGLQKLEERVLREMKDLRERRDQAFRERTELQARVEKTTGKLETTEDFLLSLEDQAMGLQEQLTEAEGRLAGLPPLEGDLPSLEEIRATVARCEKGLQAIGAVNLRALEDYETQEARHGELQEELRRLRQERQNLLKLVEELEGRKREGLLGVYGAIRENFRQVYGELSEGGEAELGLENEESPFEGGLVIRARPPNKRFLRLEALSGGEKSLVSMAFIFALQEHDPSPFYLLDEVDQNLDAMNAERIARMIKRNSASAQFVQISLRKVSLKEADHILGVTMGSRGVSEVIMQVHLDEVMEEARAAEEAAA